MKSRLLIFAGCVAMLLVLAKIYEKPLLAQVRAALVQSVDEPGRNALVLSAISTGVNVGQTTFTVPPVKRYVIEQYSIGCDVRVSYSLTNVDINTSANGDHYTSNAIPHYAQINGTGVNYWVATGTGPIYADGGSSVSINVTEPEFVPDAILFCRFSVSGHVINNP